MIRAPVAPPSDPYHGSRLMALDQANPEQRQRFEDAVTERTIYLVQNVQGRVYVETPFFKVGHPHLPERRAVVAQIEEEARLREATRRWADFNVESGIGGRLEREL